MSHPTFAIERRGLLIGATADERATWADKVGQRTGTSLASPVFPRHSPHYASRCRNPSLNCFLPYRVSWSPPRESPAKESQIKPSAHLFLAPRHNRTFGYIIANSSRSIFPCPSPTSSHSRPSLPNIMDRLLAPHTPEALAHSHLTYVPSLLLHRVAPPAYIHPSHSENWFTWDSDHPSLDETLIAGCASYQAFSQYLTGENLYLRPRTRLDLERIL